MKFENNNFCQCVSPKAKKKHQEQSLSNQLTLNVFGSLRRWREKTRQI
jgi:hypothetical protein